jgi:N-acetylglucosamine-6-phosphate deacetylase
MDGGDAAAYVARFHARHGTTAFAATTMTAPPEDLEAAFRGLSPFVRKRPAAGASVLGVHLEGPYISRERLGAQPDHTRPMALDELRALHAIAPIRLITLAPELAANRSAIRELRAEGIRVQLGHTQGTYEDAVEALSLGASGFTHLFNAMPGLHHRNPGVVGAALAKAEYAEIIPDLLHVHPGAILAALRAIPRLYCVTDSTAAAGMPDGEYQLGRHTVTKCLGGVRLADGTLAGSALTMDQALRNLVDTETLGLSLAAASRCLSTNAADHLGLQERGRLVQGAWADAVVLDTDLAIREVILEGDWLDSHA